MIDGNPAIVLFSDSGEFATDIHVTSRDICTLFEARVRVAKMLEHLCSRAGTAFGGIKRVLVSGALGGPLTGHVLGTLGFVPSVLSDKVVFIGNASKKGVQMALLDKTIADDAGELAQKVVFIPYQDM